MREEERVCGGMEVVCESLTCHAHVQPTDSLKSEAELAAIEKEVLEKQEVSLFGIWCCSVVMVTDSNIDVVCITLFS